MYSKQTLKSWLFAIFLAFTLFGYCQKDELDTKISINISNATLDDIFLEISNKSSINFTYGSDVITHTGSYDVNEISKSIKSILDGLATKANLAFLIDNNNVSVRIEDPEEIKQTVQKEIKGKITDYSGVPLPGVNILEFGTFNGTATDYNGNFEIKVENQDAILVFSFLGFKTTEVLVGNQTNISVKLFEDLNTLDEILLIGYGGQKKSSITGSVTTIKNESIYKQVVTSFEDAISGQLAGVNISQNSGAPGTTGEINIRGIGTLTAGRNPLLVIDGFPASESTDLASINPNIIESIEILKDASASAIYGSRGSNGVILITTKSGSKTKTEFFFNTYYGFQEVTKTVDLADAYEFAQLTADARNNTWLGINPSNSVEDPNSVRPGDLQIPERLFPYLEGQRGLVNTNWQDEIFRSAPVAKYELAASGGNEALTYFVGGEYQTFDGIVINTDFERYTLNANLKAQLNDKLEVGLNLAPSISTSNELNEGDHKGNGIVFTALIANPTYAPRDENGESIISEMVSDGLSQGFAPTENPVALAERTKAEKRVTQLLGSVYLNWEPIEGLQLKSQFGGQTISSREDVFRPSSLGSYAEVAPTQAFGSSETDDILNFSIENTATYNKTFADKHNFEFLAGQSFQKERVEGNDVAANNFPNDQVTTLGAGTVFFGTSYREEWALTSFFGRVNYNFDDKYLLSAAIRTDGSSRFGSNNRWGTFPSISAGWNIANEDFFGIDYINSFKVRASYGVTGNNQISNYGSVALLNESNYFFDGTLTPGLAVSSAPNENLSWEQTKMLNTGIDLSFNGGQYFLTAEYYVANTEDLLLDVPVPAHTGFNTSLQNLGKVKNTGFELSLGGTFTFGKFKWKPTANFSTNKNEVVELGTGQDRVLGTVHVTEVGKPIGSFYGYNVLGVYQNEEQLLSEPSLPNSQIGSYRYEDINGDGIISDSDRKILGDFFPDYTFGFTSRFEYKGIDLNVVVEGKQGYEIFNALGFFNYNQQGFSNVAQGVINDNNSENSPNATFAQPLATPTDKNYEFSSLMVQDGSYVRIKNISLGYALPKKVSKSVGLKYARVYVTGQNLFTFTDYDGYNPDVSSRNKSWNRSTLSRGVDYGAYPLAKSIILGLQMKF